MSVISPGSSYSQKKVQHLCNLTWIVVHSQNITICKRIHGGASHHLYTLPKDAEGAPDSDVRIVSRGASFLGLGGQRKRNLGFVSSNLVLVSELDGGK